MFNRASGTRRPANTRRSGTKAAASSRANPFDACARTERLLARRAERALSQGEQARLDAHLSECAACLRVSQADDALHRAMSLMHSPALTAQHQADFDRSVISALHGSIGAHTLSPCAQAYAWCRTLAGQLLARARALPVVWIAQASGGAIVAAGLTAWCLLPALHMGAAHHTSTAADRLLAAQIRAQHLPVPLTALLEAPAPRAAMLWTAPPPSFQARNTPHARLTHGHAPAHPKVRAAAPILRQTGLPTWKASG